MLPELYWTKTVPVLRPIRTGSFQSSHDDEDNDDDRSDHLP